MTPSSEFFLYATVMFLLLFVFIVAAAICDKEK